jgi:hypothetical protein
MVVDMRSVLEQMAFGQVSLELFSSPLPIIPPVLHMHLLSGADTKSLFEVALQRNFVLSRS